MRKLRREIFDLSPHLCSMHEFSKDLITWLLGSYWNSYMPCRMHDANPNNSLLILSPDDIFWFSLFCSVFFSSLEPTSTLSYIHVCMYIIE